MSVANRVLPATFFIGNDPQPLTTVNLMGAFASGACVAIRDMAMAGGDPWRYGLITGIRVESGYGEGSSPNHLLVSVDGANCQGPAEFYVRTA